MAVRLLYTLIWVFTQTLLNIHTSTLRQSPESSFVGAVSLPSFSSCCLCRFLLGWKAGEFLVLCQCLQTISQSCISPAAAIASHLCVALSWSGPVDPQRECSVTEKKSSRLCLPPVSLSCCNVFSSRPPKSPWWSWHFGVSYVEMESLLIRTKRASLLSPGFVCCRHQMKWYYTTHQVVAHSDQASNGEAADPANCVCLVFELFSVFHPPLFLLSGPLTVSLLMQSSFHSV